jgi:hypothetical protein
LVAAGIGLAEALRQAGLWAHSGENGDSHYFLALIWPMRAG